MNYRTTHAFNSLRDIVNAVAYRTKYASDGMDSSMPDDPSGDGFREPVTGSQFTEYTDDYSNTNPFTPNVGEGDEPSLTEENQQENSNSDFDIYVSGDGPDGQDECKTTKDDPGTSMPAEAGEEKYSAYLNYSMEENIDGFNKCAGLWLTMYQNDMEKAAGYAAMDMAEFPFTKQAMAENLPGEVVTEVAALESLPLQTREKLASMSNYELANIMDKCAAAMQQLNMAKQASLEAASRLPFGVVSSLNNLDDYSLVKVAEDMEDAADEAAIEEADIAEPTVEESEALEELDPEDLEILDSLEPEELEEIIADIDDELSEEDVDELAAESDDAMLDAAAADDIAEDMADYDDTTDEAAAVDALPEETVDKLASVSPHILYGYLTKLAEAIEDIENNVPDDADIGDVDVDEIADAAVAEDAGSEELAADEIDGLADEETEAVQSILDELPPDVADALVDMSPEELQDVIAEAEALEDDSEGGDLVDEEEAPELLSQMADETGGDEETALNDLSSAMTEEDVTPEELADMGKEGSWHFQRELVKLAAAVKAYRDAGLYRYRRPRTTKEAYARAQMHSFLNEIR